MEIGRPISMNQQSGSPMNRTYFFSLTICPHTINCIKWELRKSSDCTACAQTTIAHNYNIMQISRYASHTLSRAQNWPIMCVGKFCKNWWKKPHEYRFQATWKWSRAKAIHIWRQSLHFQLHHLNYPKSQFNLDLKSRKNEICVC